MSKRGNGEGSIYQRESDGLWVGALRDGSGKRRVFYGRTRQEVAKKQQEAQGTVAKGGVLPNRRETVGTLVDRWLQDVAPLRLRYASIQHYRSDARLHIVPALGGVKLADLTVARVQTFISSLTAKGLHPYSIRHIRAVLCAALAQAEREGLIAGNPAKLARIPSPTSPPAPVLTPDAARAIIVAFAGHDYEALIMLALATGLRVGELLGLAWDDLDLDAGTLRVGQQLQRQNRAYVLTEPKTRNTRRTLSLPTVAVTALRQHRTRQVEARLTCGPLWEDSGRVFTTASGGYLNGCTVTKRFQDRLKAAGLPRMRFHDLRHGTASLLLARGVSPRVVMEQLGHSQISVTMNTYAHVAPALMREAATLLDGALSPTADGRA